MERNPFVLHVATLLRSPGSREHRIVSGRIDDLRVGTTAVGDHSKVSADLVLESVHGGILATGEVRTCWVGECRRCLARASGEVRAFVRELFEPQPATDSVYPLTGEDLDVEPLARDAILLDLPLAPLCRQDCRGLCAACGSDLNEEACSCAEGAVHWRWAALDALKP